MNPEEIPDLIKRISYADPRIMPTDAQELMGMAAMWATVLSDVPTDYAIQAVGAHYASSPFTIKPSDIATKWKAETRQRMDRTADPAPNVDPNDEIAYRRAIRDQRQSIARGLTAPLPVAALTPAVSHDDIQAMRQQGDLAEWIKTEMRAGRQKAEQRRKLLLRHPDLAAKLCEPPLSYKTPDQWSGAVPPELDYVGRLNDAPERPAILELLAEAERRETREATA